MHSPVFRRARRAPTAAARAAAKAAAQHWADPLYRQSYLMLASTGVAAVTGLLFWVVAARRAEPAVVGTAAGLFAANAFLSYLTGFGLPYAMLRFGQRPDPAASVSVWAGTAPTHPVRGRGDRVTAILNARGA